MVLGSFCTWTRAPDSVLFRFRFFVGDTLVGMITSRALASEPCQKRLNAYERLSENTVSELEEAWATGLAEAEARARAQGRADIADYLALRSSNDLIRKIAGDWLLAMFANAAGEANRKGAAIQISSEDAHRFKVGNASMVGTRLSLSSGVRQLFVEAGWPRTPRDGFIRGGGLACCHIKHVGIKPANEELRLVVDEMSGRAHRDRDLHQPA